MVDRMVVVQDLAGVGLRSMHRPFTSLMQLVTRVRTDHYPQVLKHMVIINAPTVINVLYALVKPMLTERTRRKVIFVRGNPIRYLAGIINPYVETVVCLFCPVDVFVVPLLSVPPAL